MLEQLETELVNVFNLLTDKQKADLVENGKICCYKINEKPFVVQDGKHTKTCFSEDYSFIFDKDTGNFKRWGKTYDEDPEFSPVGPEILDIEITTKCKGVACCVSADLGKS